MKYPQQSKSKVRNFSKKRGKKTVILLFPDHAKILFLFDFPQQKSIFVFFLVAMPMGQMPVLEVDGKRVHQSLAMCRYVAKQCGLAGNDAFEDLQIDALVDTINEFRLSEFFWLNYEKS